jgi:hypothetical protein
VDYNLSQPDGDLDIPYKRQVCVDTSNPMRPAVLPLSEDEDPQLNGIKADLGDRLVPACLERNRVVNEAGYHKQVEQGRAAQETLRRNDDRSGQTMVPQVPGDILTALLSEIRSLQAEIRDLRAVLALAPEARVAVEPAPVFLDASFQRTDKDRMPFVLKLDGAVTGEKKLTVVGTAILLVLLADLQCRRSGVGIEGKFSRIADIDLMLTAALESTQTRRGDGAISDSSNHDIKRVKTAYDRFLNDYNTNKWIRAKVEGAEVNITKNSCQLDLIFTKHPAPPVEVRFRISDPALRGCLDDLKVSPLDLVRRHSVMHVAGGPEGFDQLFLDLFDHADEVTERSLFYKPSITTYPADLLDALNASQQDRRRKDVLLKGYDTGRCKFIEILNRQTLREMIQLDRSGAFRLYGPRVTDRMVLAHFDALVELLKTKPHYQLVLTDAPLPFLLSTFDRQGQRSESFTVFFRQLIREHDPDVECFAICNSDVTRSINEKVIGGVVRHSTTTTEREDVIAELKRYSEQLRRSGPTPAD